MCYEGYYVKHFIEIANVYIIFKLMAKDDKKYYKERLEFSRNQRLIALKNAFKTIDAFAQPSLDPETYSNYEEVKEDLIKNYSRK